MINDGQTDFGRKRFLTPEMRDLITANGGKNLKKLGAVAFAAMLTAYSPDVFAQAPINSYMSPTASPLITMMMELNGFVTDLYKVSSDDVGQFMSGASEMAAGVSYYIQESIIAPAVGTTNGLSSWAGAQRDAIVSMGVSAIDTVRDVVRHIIPDTAGEAVEKGIIIIAALKSFTEGVSLLKRGMSRLFGKEENPPKAESQIIHHHHYYNQVPEEKEPVIIDMEVIKDVPLIEHDNDNDPVI